MNDDRWRRVEELFDHAAALPPEERGVFLDNACADDEGLRQEVESLLAHDQSQNNLVRAAIEDAIRKARDSRSLSDLVGKQIGPYSILGLLGQGGMGVVYEARDSRLERHVAIKILSEYLMNGMLRQRFEREARAASALNHPNICSIYDAGEWEGRPFLVMELLEGRTLREHVDTQPRHIREILGLTSEILEALQAAHAKGIVHRDIKPANIFVTKSGHVKLLDFGLASRLGLTVELEESTLPDKLTDPGSVIGTIAYMSPEQARGEAVDARGDLWSLGVVLYEMVTGDQPFVGPTSAVVFDSILNKTPIPVRERNPELPAGLERIIAKLLEKDRELRYQSAAEVQADLGNPVFTTAKRARSSASGLSGKAGFKDALGTTRRNVSAPSIAILPFANLSGDKEQEYFSDGLAEEITNALSQIPGLKVTARTSAFAFRGKEQDIRKIAKVLHVSTILEGSVRKSGNRIRVTAQLINAADGYHIWSQRYDRELVDVFAVQDEIAEAIAGALKVTLIGIPAGQRYHPSLRAYDLFLLARHEISSLRVKPTSRAKELLERAIVLDPAYAAPHAELGHYYYLAGALGFASVREAMLAARAHAQKALDLAREDSRARAVLCAVASVYDHDWDEAGRHYALAVAADPVSPEVRVRCALSYLLPLGRFQDALSQFEKALEQDPLHAIHRAFFASALLCAGLHDRALAESEKSLQLDENHWIPLFSKSVALIQRGSLAEAREAAEKATRADPRRATPLGLLAGILARLGQSGQLPEYVARLREMAPGGLFWYHLLTSEIDSAADYYAKWIEQRDPEAIFLASAVFLKPIRSSPRWPGLAKMMNLPAEAIPASIGLSP